MSGIIKNNKLTLVNPITNKNIGELNVCDQDSFSTVENNALQFTDWNDLSIKKRCYYIKQFQKAILDNKDHIQQILITETGKKDFDAFIELFTTLEHLKGITKIAKKSLQKSVRNTGLLKNKKAYVQYEPLGVVGIISPWNYPLATPMTTVSEALIAGNNVILKPSEHTPLVIQFLKELWDKRVGYKNAFQVIHGGGDVGEMLVKSNNNDLICFTGSTAIGKKIAKQCAENLKPIILELGGKDPMIILKDANQRKALEAALFGGLMNAGQSCISVENIYIEESIFDEFTLKISDKIKNMSSGESENDSISCIITPDNYTKINSHLSELDDSTEVIKGTASNGEYYIAPTVVISPPLDSKIINEETFGPVMVLTSFSNDLNLVNTINKNGYGLSGSIFGENKKRIKNIIKNIKTGTMSVNDLFSHYGITSLPFGGEGKSGLGRLHGKEGLRSFSRVKSIVESKYQFIDDPWWFNRSKKIESLLKKVVSLLYKW